jgi:hypothetical protein
MQVFNLLLPKLPFSSNLIKMYFPLSILLQKVMKKRITGMVFILVVAINPKIGDCK